MHVEKLFQVVDLLRLLIKLIDLGGELVELGKRTVNLGIVHVAGPVEGRLVIVLELNERNFIVLLDKNKLYMEILSGPLARFPCLRHQIYEFIFIDVFWQKHIYIRYHTCSSYMTSLYKKNFLRSKRRLNIRQAGLLS